MTVMLADEAPGVWQSLGVTAGAIVIAFGILGALIKFPPTGWIFKHLVIMPLRSWVREANKDEVKKQVETSLKPITAQVTGLEETVESIAEAVNHTKIGATPIKDKVGLLHVGQSEMKVSLESLHANQQAADRKIDKVAGQVDIILDLVKQWIGKGNSE